VGIFRPKGLNNSKSSTPLVKAVRLIELKDSRMEKITETGASKLFSSENIKKKRLDTRDGQGMQHT